MARVQLLECSLNIKSNESTAAVVKRAHASGPMCFHLVLFEDDLTISGFTYFPCEIGIVYYGTTGCNGHRRSIAARTVQNYYVIMRY